MPSLVHCCGFECGASSSHWTVSSPGSFSTTTVRTNGRSLRSNPAASAGGQHNIAATPLGGTVQVHRFYVYFASLPNADCAIFFYPTTPRTAVVFKTSDSKLYPHDGTSFGASGVSVTTGQWYRIDFRVELSTNIMDLQVNGTAVTQFDGTGSIAGATTVAFGSINIGGGNISADIFFDDYCASQTSADYPIGPGYVDHFIPTADGTHNIAGTGDFQRGNTATDILNATTTAFQLVDNEPLPSAAEAADNIAGIAPANPTTDYVECVFGPGTGVSIPSVAPRGVEVILGYHQSATQTGQMEVRINDNGTTDSMFNTGAAAGVTTIRYARKHYATAPTGGAWTVTSGAGNFKNLRFRFLAQDAAPDQFLDAIMIEAEFAEVAFNTQQRKQTIVQQSVARAANI